MADDKIVHRISLEGAEDVANKLKKIGDTSSDAFKKVKQFTDDSFSGVGKYGDAIAALDGKTSGAHQATERSRNPGRRWTMAPRTLHRPRRVCASLHHQPSETLPAILTSEMP